MKANTFRDLAIWQKSVSFVTEVYRITNSFPKDELYGLTNQMRRAAVSLPCNIAEGFGRRTKPEFSRYLQIAIGSLFEMQTQLQIAYNLGYMNSALRCLIRSIA